MLKRTLLLALIGTATVNANARNPFTMVQGKKTKEAAAVQQAIFAAQMAPATADKPTATAKRLIGIAAYEGTTRLDTLIYKYKPTFGSEHPTLLSYFSGYYASDPLSVQYVKFDSLYTIYTGASQPELSIVVNKYNADRAVTNIISIEDDATSEEAMTYNSNGQQVTYAEIDSFDTGVFAETRKSYRTYDTQGKIAVDSMVDLQSSSNNALTRYTYTGGLLTKVIYAYFDGNNYVPSGMNEYAYDGQGRMVLDTRSYDNGTGVFAPVSRDTFGYTGAANQYTFEGSQEWDKNTATWGAVEFANLYTLNSQGQPTYLVSVYVNGGVITDTSGRYVVTYNGSNLVSNMALQYYTGNGNFDAPYNEYFFYYEDYQTSSIADVANKGIAISLYPNPAQGAITVNAEGAANYTVTDMQGRVLLQATAQPKATTVNVSTLTAGNYIITVQNAQGAKLGSKLFSKQ